MLNTILDHPGEVVLILIVVTACVAGLIEVIRK